MRMLTIIEEFSKRGLTIHCARRIGSIQVAAQLAYVIVAHGKSEYIRSNNGPQIIAKDLRK